MAAENIGNLVPTKIPGYVDSADIQAALRLYHYGSYSYDPANTSTASLVNPSIAWTINDLQGQIDVLDENAIVPTIFTAKGSLIASSATSTPSELLVGGSNGLVLTVNSATATGLAWEAPSVTPTNTVTLTNKTLTSPTVDGTGIIFEGTTADSYETTLTVIDPTADRTVTIPNATGTVQLQELEFNAQVNTTYTFTLADQSKIITADNGSAQTYTIPSNTSAPFPIGAQIIVIQKGDGQITIQASNSGTTTVLSTAQVTPYAPRIRTKNGAAAVIKAGTETWYVIGDIQ